MGVLVVMLVTKELKKIFNLDVNTIGECDHLSNIFAFGPAVAKFAEIF